MAAITPESWRTLPTRSELFAELAASPVPNADGVFLAVDHDGVRHLLLATEGEDDPVNDDRSRGVHALTRPLAVQGQAEREFIDVVCTSTAGQDVFNLVASAIVESISQGGDPPEAVRGTLARWRRFWGTAPEPGLTPQELRGLIGELWFLAVWLLPHGHEQVAHWLGPTGARHDFQWPRLAVEAKATTSVRGHVHRIHGLDQLEPPTDGRLCVFSLRLREEATAANSLVTLIERITGELANHPDTLDGFETRLTQAGYAATHAERYADVRFRVVNERVYEVGDGFPRLSADSFVDGLPAGIESVEYEINLDACPSLLIASSPSEFSLA